MSLLGFLKPVVYARLEPELLSLREVRSGNMVSGPPLAAISKHKVVAVGETARWQAGQVVNPFKHPRALIADFTVAGAVLKGFMKKLFEGRWFSPAPLLVLHPRVIPEGGVPLVGAGAYKVIVWQGRDLADEELLAGDFSGT